LIRKLLLTGLMVTFIGLSGAIEITVGPTDSDFSSIQDAVNAARAGDLIEVRGGIYHENVVVDKKLDLKGLGEPVVDAMGKGSTFVLLADDAALNGFIITGSRNLPGQMEAGIKAFSGNNNISNNAVTGNVNGIMLENSNDSIIINNKVYGNRENGIYLDRSQRNVLVENNVSNNGHDNGGTGIYLYMRCNYNSIRDNEVHNNDLDGIMISSSDNNTIQHNNVSANGDGGIHLNCGSLNNTVTMNNATKNKFGIYLTVAMSSWIYLNNFFNNTENVRTWSSANFWNSRGLVKYSYDSITHNNYTGNHWSDYSGNDTNNDGLGDEPYTIVPDSLPYPTVQEEASLWAMHTDFVDADHYPLMRRYEVYNATDAGSRS
jgi:parallel beta-helix repeat protein